MTNYVSHDEFRLLGEVADELGLDRAVVQPITRRSVQVG